MCSLSAQSASYMLRDAGAAGFPLAPSMAPQVVIRCMRWMLVLALLSGAGFDLPTPMLSSFAPSNEGSPSLEAGTWEKERRLMQESFCAWTSCEFWL